MKRSTTPKETRRETGKEEKRESSGEGKGERKKPEKKIKTPKGKYRRRGVGRVIFGQCTRKISQVQCPMGKKGWGKEEAMVKKDTRKKKLSSVDFTSFIARWDVAN